MNAQTWLATASLAIFATVAVDQAQAFRIFFDEDVNDFGANNAPVIPFPNSEAAENAFLANLTGVDTEDFESFDPSDSEPLNLEFTGIDDMGNFETVNATLTGGDAQIFDVDSESSPPDQAGTDGEGRFNITPGGSQFLLTDAGADFAVDVDRPISAFGFYATDIGDFEGQLILTLLDGTTEVFNINTNNTDGSGGDTSGSVFYLGILGEDETEVFTSVEFATTTGTGDRFGFDDFTIGTFSQITPVPNPAPFALMGLGLVALTVQQRKHLKG